MSGLQTIINNASAISINRPKLAGHTISRSGRVKTIGVASAIPWQFSITIDDGLRYSENRALLEELDRIDRVLPTTIDIGATNAGLRYITAYEPLLSIQQLRDCTILSTGTNSINIDVSHLTNIGSQDLIFRKGDYIQPGGQGTNEDDYPYPYTVTEDIVKGVLSSRPIPLSRPFIPTSAVNVVNAAYGVRTGHFVTWTVIVLSKPSYKLLPGDRIGWSGDFELLEVIE